ncbi:hypothetical protein [Cytophaga aurantiaca]|uniref:hypothetical protein n=1 Tax=Cytophaga aurantiaca TaxID=29530 RepID=UPI000377B2D2|nr:hypothetical protein [Cytophaga aurantiaca]
MIKYTFIILIFISVSSFAQTAEDYLYVNKVLNKPRRTKLPFLFGGDLLSKEYNGELYNENEEEVLEHYAFSINELFADTLKQYIGVIDKQKIKNSFVAWDKKRINSNTFTEDVKKDFCYITKPIVLDNGLFVILQFDECAMGGITACLYQYNKDSKSVNMIKLHTMRLYGFSNEW